MTNNINFKANLKILNPNDKQALSKKSVTHLTKLARDIKGDEIILSLDKGSQKIKGQKPKIVHNLILTQGKFVSEHLNLPFKTNIAEIVEQVFNELKNKKVSVPKKNKAKKTLPVLTATPQNTNQLDEKTRIEHEKADLELQKAKKLKEVKTYLKNLETNPDGCKLKFEYRYEKTHFLDSNPGNIIDWLDINDLKPLADIISEIEDKEATIKISINGRSRNYWDNEIATYNVEISNNIYQSKDKNTTSSNKKSYFDCDIKQKRSYYLDPEQCEIDENNRRKNIKTKLFNKIEDELEAIRENYALPYDFDENLDINLQIKKIFFELKQVNKKLLEENQAMKKKISNLEEKLKF